MTHRNHNEREFEAFLAGEESELARLYRRLPQAEPDAKLDAAVLNLARAAVEPQRVNALRHAKSRHPRPWWLVGLSSAAGVVLAAGIAWQMRHGFDGHPAANMTPAPQSRAAQSGRDVIPISAITPPAEAEAPAAPAAPPAPPPPPALSDSQPGAAAATKPQPPAQRLARSSAPPRDADKAKAEAARGAGPVTPIAAEPLPAPAPAAAPAPVPASKADMQAESAAADSRSDELAVRSDRRGTAAAPKPFADSERALDHNSVERKAAIASGSRREEYGLSAEEAAAGETSARPEIRQRAPARMQSDAAADGRVSETMRRSEPAPKKAVAAAPPPPAAEATPAFEPPAAAPAAVPAADASARARSSDAAAPAAAAAPTADAYTSAAAPPAPATTTAVTQPAATSPLGGVSAGRSSADDETVRRATALEHNARLAPAKWVEQIQQLLREQRRDEARENLDLFRKRHPDFVLPPELRELK